MGGSTEPAEPTAPAAPAAPLVAVTTWRRTGRVWGEWPRDVVGVEAFYSNALTAVGLAPVLLPAATPAAAAGLVSAVQGLMVIGGEDLHPEVSGVDPAVAGSNTSADRDRWELALLGSALERDLPVLAICRGMQLLNVLHGGTLMGDMAGCSAVHPAVPSELDQALAYRHDVTLASGSLLASTYGTGRRPVNSLHHQAVDRLGSGLRVTARADDGIVEGIEPEGARWCAAMQWHPELLPDDPHEKQLFAEFARECAG